MIISESRIIMSCSALYILVVIIFVISCNIGFYYSENDVAKDHENKIAPVKPEDAYLIHRKLMLHGVCSKWDISISQSRYPTPGIPLFIVEIVNTCVSSSGCAPSNIHLKCGWFASARTVNPRTFKRLSFDDCLVNGGLPLKSSQSIRFTYANSFMYPLHFKSATFC